MKKKVYFISYAWSRGSKNGNGCCSIVRDVKIKSFEDLFGIATHIADKEEFDQVVITNYKRLKR